MKLGFYSCMSGVPWGGSEELWYRAARLLNSEGHQVLVNFKWWPEQAKQLTELGKAGAEICHRQQPAKFWDTKAADFRKLLFNANQEPSEQGAAKWLRETRPDMVLVTLGYHPDTIQVADDCIKKSIPYAINVQAASYFTFVGGGRCEDYQRWYQNAEKVFFVSPENQHKLETNLACQLTNAEIVDNPFNVDFQVQVPYPAGPADPAAESNNTDETFRLACVGRIHFQSKGQDLVVDVLKQDKWRDRNLQVSFYGKDQGQRYQLQKLIELHGLQDKMRIAGFASDITEIWRENHGLLLPSRYEGAALVVIEAMLCRRVCVMTDTGRNRELCDDNETGFIADFPSARSLDEALERAWQARSNWQAMGIEAGRQIRQRYSNDPVRDYALKIKQVATAKKV